jgi:hypothetical protein
MKISEKIYKLGNEKGEKINTTDNLIVCINGIQTRILLKTLFQVYKQEEDRIKGYSFLGNYPVVDDCIRVSDNISICAINKNTDDIIYITRVHEPFFQMMDKESDTESIVKILEEEWSRIKPKSIIDEVIVEEEAVSEEEVPEEEIIETQEEVAEPVKEDKFDYEAQKEKLLKSGYKEYESGKYKLLFNKTSKKGGLYKDGKKITYMKISDEQDIKTLRVEVEEEDLVFNVG